MIHVKCLIQTLDHWQSRQNTLSAIKKVHMKIDGLLNLAELFQDCNFSFVSPKYMRLSSGPATITFLQYPSDAWMPQSHRYRKISRFEHTQYKMVNISIRIALHGNRKSADRERVVRCVMRIFSIRLAKLLCCQKYKMQCSLALIKFILELQIRPCQFKTVKWFFYLVCFVFILLWCPNHFFMVWFLASASHLDRIKFRSALKHMNKSYSICLN